MTRAHRQEELDHHMGDSNWKKLLQAVPSLIKKWREAKNEYPDSIRRLKELEANIPAEKLLKWQSENDRAQKSRLKKPKAMDIYDCLMMKPPGKHEIQLGLTRDEARCGVPRGTASWLSSGLRLQEDQLALRGRIRRMGRSLTVLQSQDVEDKRTRLQKRIDAYHANAEKYMGCDTADLQDAIEASQGSDFDWVPDLDHHETDDGEIEDEELRDNLTLFPEHIPILLPSALGATKCAEFSLTKLIGLELQLRKGQANDVIHNLRLAIGYKSVLFRTKMSQHLSLIKHVFTVNAGKHCLF
ncbi:hypothetical protein PsYK624_171750 [Phanerochaete sordida]|uniref:Uncharacterized protein n=1 Tax=Phanerochaete sordida TaxID=48140 RepID=A0A9P3LPU1_9APHY|nr:hypothetical protein PsYK624_171750 [Phanerochaete sordida]